ncbi:MAG: hypothetical protein M3032_02505 [Verrucomicrobiota bacterium]|nr:hypothetical protein [Verrucomicrobiota bacterium]
MNKFFLVLLAAAALGFGGCASDGIEADQPDQRGPAPYSPDPMGHIPVYENNNPQHGPTT